MFDARYTTECVHNLTDADRYESRPMSVGFPSDEFEPRPAPAFHEFMPQWAIDRAIARDEGRRLGLPVWKLTAATFIAAPSARSAHQLAVDSGWTEGLGVIRIRRDEEPTGSTYLCKDASPVVEHPLNGEPTTQAAIDLEMAESDAEGLGFRVYKLVAADGATTYYAGRNAVHAYRQAFDAGWTSGRGKVRVSRHVEAQPVEPDADAMTLARQAAEREAAKHEGWRVFTVECNGEFIPAAGRDASHAVRQLIRSGWVAPAITIVVDGVVTLDSRSIFGLPWDRPAA